MSITAASRLLVLPPLLLLLLAACTSCQPAPFPLDEAAVRGVLVEAMRCMNLPQLHVAVVHAGHELRSFRLELLANDSVADIASARAILLPIASVSKGMFATALPRVQEQLRKDRGDPSFNLLTTPIKQLLGDKEFWFIDPGRTDSVTIEDLASHTTGLTRHDALSIWFGVKTKSELTQRLGRFNATGTFRGSFIYNNLAWTVADYVVERLTGKNFTTYMREFLWQPIGMSGTIGSSEMDSRGRVRHLFRSPKHFLSGRVPLDRTELEKSLDLVEAAGGIYVPLEDMVKYMQYHTQANYSSHMPPPEPFKSVNAFASEALPYDPRMFNDSVSDLPEVDMESYGRGWVRSWYRDNLSYDHSGSFFGAHCQLRVLPKRRLSVFSHTSLGPSDSPFQSAYAGILGSYLTDLLMRNDSFVTRSNVCSLFRPISPGEPVPVPRRTLTEADLQICTGSFGNYGFGTMSVSLNASRSQLYATYGSAVLEMVPVQLPGQSAESPYSFFITIQRPVGFPVASPIVGENGSHVMVRPEVLRQPQQQPQTPLFLQIWHLPGSSRVLANTPALDASALFEKGLRPESWQRPVPCPPDGKGAAGVAACGVAWRMSTVAAAAAALWFVWTAGES